jgi:hypothetical protein
VLVIQKHFEGLKSWDLVVKLVILPNPVKTVFINNFAAGFGEIDEFSDPVILRMTEPPSPSVLPPENGIGNTRMWGRGCQPTSLVVTHTHITVHVLVQELVHIYVHKLV